MNVRNWFAVERPVVGIRPKGAAKEITLNCGHILFFTGPMLAVLDEDPALEDRLVCPYCSNQTDPNK
jgi:hypothetical protein